MEKKKIKDVEEMPVYGLLYRLALGIEKVTRSCPQDFRWLRKRKIAVRGKGKPGQVRESHAEYPASDGDHP